MEKIYYLKNHFNMNPTGLIVQESKLYNNFDRHIHRDFYEMVVINNGKGTHVINSVSYQTAAGDICVLGGETNHSFKDISCLGLYNIIFSPGILAPYSHIFNSVSGYQALFVLEPSIRTSRELCSVFHVNTHELDNIKRIISDIKDNEGKHVSISYFIELILYICRLYSQYRHNDSPVMIAAELAAFIKANYMDDIQIKEIYGRIPLSSRHIQRLFKKYYNMTPSEFLIDTRFENAGKELLHSNEKISQIAMKNGFNDPNYFSRLFKQKFGISPLQFRKNNGTINRK